ncbi:chemotaxis protein CheW [Vibrio sp.]|nr:chemotaxis protein CheW [Vibrio sp.]
MTDLEQIADIDDEIEIEKTEFLSFIVGNETYGIKITEIEEIRVWQKPTLIPNVPDFVKGVINIRGMIIPIFDMRIRFGTSEINYLETTVIIVLKVKVSEDKDKVIGLVVDAVADVLALANDSVIPLQRESNLSEFINGIAQIENGLVTILSSSSLSGFIIESEEIHHVK